jgi:hypothetical protein
VVARRDHYEHPAIRVSTVYTTPESRENRGLVEHVHRGHGAYAPIRSTTDRFRTTFGEVGHITTDDECVL